ncbi:MAG: alkaline phosphatase family protein [Polyangiaceae bacterium]
MQAVRRLALTLSTFAAGAIFMAAGCDEGTIPSVMPGPAAWNRAVTRPDDATAASKRASCGYKAGDLPGETLGASTPVDKDIPIQKIVVLMQENRSFDSYFGALAKFANRTDIESPLDNITNPEVPGVAGSPTHPRSHAPHKCTLDTDHSWRAQHADYDNGANDGFWQTNNDPAQPNDTGDGARALFYYDQTDLPFYYQLANTFGIADHYHCALLGPTWPNRMYFYSATSFGRVDNTFPDLSGKTYPDVMTSIFDELEQRQITWNIFADSTPGAAVVYATSIINRWDRNPILRSSDLMTQIAAGTLPQVSIIDGQLGAEGPAGNDEHPPGDIEIGQKFSADIIQALMKSPDWPHIVFIQTYDENGGFYDHVVPPAACPPDDTPADLTGSDAAFPGGFDREGFRVPMLVVSPFAKKAYVSHVTYDHTSVTRFIETKFRLPALTNRDANADPLMDFFDFKNPPFLTPPTLTEPSIDQNEADYCSSTYTKGAGG